MKPAWTDSVTWTLLLSWALPMTTADDYVKTPETSNSVKALSLAAIAALILANVPELQNSYSQAGVAIFVGAAFSFGLEFASSLRGKSIPRGVVINTYANLIVCLFIYLLITHFDLLAIVGMSKWGQGSETTYYVFATIVSAALTFMIWITKSLLLSKTTFSFKDIGFGAAVITLCAIFTYVFDQYPIGDIFSIFAVTG